MGHTNRTKATMKVNLRSWFLSTRGKERMLSHNIAATLCVTPTSMALKSLDTIIEPREALETAISEPV